MGRNGASGSESNSKALLQPEDNFGLEDCALPFDWVDQEIEQKSTEPEHPFDLLVKAIIAANPAGGASPQERFRDVLSLLLGKKHQGRPPELDDDVLMDVARIVRAKLFPPQINEDVLLDDEKLKAHIQGALDGVSLQTIITEVLVRRKGELFAREPDGANKDVRRVGQQFRKHCKQLLARVEHEFHYPGRRDALADVELIARTLHRLGIPVDLKLIASRRPTGR